MQKIKKCSFNSPFWHAKQVSHFYGTGSLFITTTSRPSSLQKCASLSPWKEVQIYLKLIKISKNRSHIMEIELKLHKSRVFQNFIGIFCAVSTAGKIVIMSTLCLQMIDAVTSWRWRPLTSECRCVAIHTEPFSCSCLFLVSLFHAQVKQYGESTVCSYRVRGFRGYQSESCLQ